MRTYLVDLDILEVKEGSVCLTLRRDDKMTFSALQILAEISIGAKSIVVDTYYLTFYPKIISAISQRQDVKVVALQVPDSSTPTVAVTPSAEGIDRADDASLPIADLYKAIQTTPEHRRRFLVHYLVAMKVLTHAGGVGKIRIDRQMPLYVIELLVKDPLPCRVIHIDIHLTILAAFPTAIANVIARHETDVTSLDVIYQKEDAMIFDTPLFPWALGIFLDSLPSDTASLAFKEQPNSHLPGKLRNWDEKEARAAHEDMLLDVQMQSYYHTTAKAPQPLPIAIGNLAVPAPLFASRRMLRVLRPASTFCMVEKLCIGSIRTQEQLDTLRDHLPPTLETLELMVDSDGIPLSFVLTSAPKLRHFVYRDIAERDNIDTADRRALLRLPSGVQSLSIPMNFTSIAFGQPRGVQRIALQQNHRTATRSPCSATWRLGSTLRALAASSLSDVELTIEVPHDAHFSRGRSPVVPRPCSCWVALSNACKGRSFEWVRHLHFKASRFSSSIYVSFATPSRHIDPLLTHLQDFLCPLIKLCPALLIIGFTFGDTMKTTDAERIKCLVERIVRESLSPHAIQDNGVFFVKLVNQLWGPLPAGATPW